MNIFVELYVFCKNGGNVTWISTLQTVLCNSKLVTIVWLQIRVTDIYLIHQLQNRRTCFFYYSAQNNFLLYQVHWGGQLSRLKPRLQDLHFTNLHFSGIHHIVLSASIDGTRPKYERSFLEQNTCLFWRHADGCSFEGVTWSKLITCRRILKGDLGILVNKGTARFSPHKQMLWKLETISAW